jgi:hypothetical protein
MTRLGYVLQQIHGHGLRLKDDESGHALSSEGDSVMIGASRVVVIV